VTAQSWVVNRSRREVVVAQGVWQVFGKGLYEMDRFCGWKYIENVSCWGSVILLCLFMHALGVTTG